MGRVAAVRFARIVLALALALALAACASAPESRAPAPRAPDAAAARLFTPPHDFTDAQSAPFTFSSWDTTDPPSPTRTRYYRYPDYYRYYQYYALSSAIACLLTGVTVGVLWLLGWW
jgi:hypothetical protein